MVDGPLTLSPSHPLTYSPLTPSLIEHVAGSVQVEEREPVVVHAIADILKALLPGAVWISAWRILVVAQLPFRLRDHIGKDRGRGTVALCKPNRQQHLYSQGELGVRCVELYAG